MRFVVTVLGLALIWTAAFVLGRYTWFWVPPVFGGILTYIFIRRSIGKVQSDPPHQGILVFLGRRLKKLLREGWVWTPFAPFIFDAYEVKVVKVNQDLPVQTPRTPDYAELGVSVSITWTPGLTGEAAKEVRGRDNLSEAGIEKEQAEALIEYLNSGEEAGVREIIEDIVRDRLRVWAFSREEGPADWKEATGAKDDTIAVLLKAILGETLPTIPSDVPTSVLLKYFNLPRLRPLKFEAEKYGENWEKLEKELNELSSQNLEDLKEKIEERRKVIGKLRHGDGAFYKKSLGITINRFTVNEVILRGKTSVAVESVAEKFYEQEADETEIKNVLARIQYLKEKLDISVEQAIEMVQTERRKVVKSITEGKLNISPETRAMIEKLFPGLLAELFKIVKQKK